ncbi:hypothetical protein M413DRAFT_19287 [Hebeloma cylindrosporum]|uniref:Chromatin associated protein KTI12 n=1 Tax=Hebeloma cylindrosporum TaxID=76867 RepID=A0A0C3C751_HEBCY|nr:hypothetical protein M413DRAFT_19287 [Hebeloma cylindrosporum h7]
MALITIAGFPSSGKSTRARQIQAALETRLNDDGPKFRVLLLSDHSLHILPSAYDHSALEKPARGTLFAAVQRFLATDTILILDSLNYIKGFRYQLYCAVREMKLRTCTVYIVAPPDLCRQWNSHRENGSLTDLHSLDNLLVRFEEPSSMVRWDTPLFTVAWDDPQIPDSQIWDAITKGNVKPPNSGTLAVAKAPVDALQTLERTSTAMVSAVLSASQSGGGPTVVPVGTDGVEVIVRLPSRHLTLSELQRVKRQFVTVHKKAITLGTTERGAVDWSEESVAKKFAEYMADCIT